jgi:hypothetical protein
VIGLDTVVGVLVGTMPRRGEQLVPHDRVGCRLIGDDLDRGDPGRADGLFEAPACGLGIAL